MIEKLHRTDEEWRRLLPPDRYHVLREKGTEPPFRNEYDDHWEPGTYHCYACENKLFSSEAKFHSGTGWPSFSQPISPEAVEEHVDRSFGIDRTEVRLRPLRQSSGARFRRRPEAHGSSLLHELGVAQVCAGGVLEGAGQCVEVRTWRRRWGSANAGEADDYPLDGVKEVGRKRSAHRAG